MSNAPTVGVGTTSYAQSQVSDEYTTQSIGWSMPAQPDAPSGSTGTVTGTGDGVADDRAGVVDALDDVIAGGNCEVPAGTWRIGSSITREFTGDVRIWGAGALKLDAGKVLNIEAEHADYVQDNEVSVGDTTIDVTDATGILVGDVVEIRNTLSGDTQWNQDRRDISTVASVSSNTLTLDDAIAFDHPSATNQYVRVYTQAELQLELAGFETGENGLVLVGWKSVDVRGLTVTGPGSVAPPTSNGLVLRACTDVYVEDLTGNTLVHAFKVSRCRDVRAFGIQSFDCFQPIVINDFSHRVYIERVTSDDTDGGSVDSHPAFDIEYSNVRQHAGDSGFNMRGMGGRLTDLNITMNAPSQSRLQTSSLVDDTPYNVADLDLLRVVSTNGEVNVNDGRDVAMTDCEFYSLQFGQHQQPATVVLTRVTAGSLRIRQPTVTLDTVTLTGGDATRDHLLDLEQHGTLVASDCVFSGADYVLKQDTTGGANPRTYTDCDFACDVSFSDLMADQNYMYTFVRCDFTNVAAFPAWMLRPAVTYTDCINAPA